MGCAVANATGRCVQQIPLTPPRVLGLILGRQEPIEFPHISQDWWDNVLMRRPGQARATI